MGYLHIPNLYADRAIMEFRWCYALEKIHGTSAHIRWKDGAVSFFSGGAKHEEFLRLFDAGDLALRFAALGHDSVCVYGEAHGGKLQKMKDTYGPDLRFTVFDVMVGDSWLGVPDMQQVASGALGFEVVPWIETPTDIEALNAVRDAPSLVAVIRGCGGDKQREGIVLRPPFECRRNDGKRIIAKHKAENFQETTTPRQVDAGELGVLEDAQAIADEWVTDMRLAHVLDSLSVAGQVPGIEQTGDVLRAMVEDVEREAGPEIVVSKAARRAIGKRAGEMFKARLRNSLR